jgi:hypothetical protein
VSDDLRYLNDDHYYQWGEYEGELSIYSECCADRFSPDEELELLRYLLAKHPQPDPLATLRAEVERERDDAARAHMLDRTDMSAEVMRFSFQLVLDLIDKQREGQ